MRLVGKNAADGGKLRAACGILPVRYVQKALRRGKAQPVRVRKAVINTLRLHGVDAEDQLRFAGLQPVKAAVARRKGKPIDPRGKHRKRRLRRIRRFIQRQGQIFASERRLLCHKTARAAAGPAILVVDPWLHAEFLRPFYAGIRQSEPVFAQILRLQASARVHEKAAEAHFMQHVDLPQELLLLQLSVPRPKGLAAIGGGGIMKFLFQRFHRQVQSQAEPARRSGCCRPAGACVPV